MHLTNNHCMLLPPGGRAPAVESPPLHACRLAAVLLACRPAPPCLQSWRRPAADAFEEILCSIQKFTMLLLCIAHMPSS